MGKTNDAIILIFTKIWVSDKSFLLHLHDTIQMWASYPLIPPLIFSVLLQCKSNNRRFFHSFSVKLPYSRRLHSAADLEFVTSCGQNGFPARNPFEQRGPLWRTSCHVCLTELKKAAAPAGTPRWRRATIRHSCVWMLLWICSVHANFLTIQPRTLEMAPCRLTGGSLDLHEAHGES